MRAVEREIERATPDVAPYLIDAYADWKRDYKERAEAITAYAAVVGAPHTMIGLEKFVQEWHARCYAERETVVAALRARGVSPVTRDDVDAEVRRQREARRSGHIF